MGQSDTVGLTLGSFLGVILGKDRLVGNEGQAAVHESIPELGRAVLDHMAGELRLTRLEVPRFHVIL